MNKQKSRSAFIGEYGPADWLNLKQEVLDPNAFEMELILPIIEERARHQPDLAVLDCGSGEGHFTELLRRTTKSSKVIGLDIYRKYIEKTLSNFTNTSTCYLQSNIYKMPFSDAIFDIVASQSTFDILHGELMFKEMLRVLKPSGWLYISMAYDSSYPFTPEHNRELEEKIQRNFDLYGVEWGERDGMREGDSRCGRNLWYYAKRYDLTILKFSVSSWVLYPNPDYSPKEKAVINLILDLYYQANKRALLEQRIDIHTLDEWKLKLQNDIESNRLAFIIHQNSLLAEKSK